MTNQEILTEAIQRATAAGWNPFPNGDEDSVKLLHLQPFEHIIFNHDFAKTLWGEREVSDKCKCGSPADKVHTAVGGPGSTVTHGQVITNAGWRYRLQQMVVAEDPIKYLGEHLPE